MSSRARFSVTLPAEAIEDVEILLVGCGGIGSYTALLLAKMGLTNMTLVDHDLVEEENVGTQIYGNSAIGLSKTDALSDLILEHSDASTTTSHEARYDKTQLQLMRAPRRIYIAAVDNMETRRTFFADVMAWTCANVHAMPGPPQVKALWIDPRMTLEFLEVNSFDISGGIRLGTHLKLYKNRLNDKNAEYEEAPCGERAIPGTGMWAAHTILSIILRWCKGERFPHLVQGTMGCAPDAEEGIDALAPVVEGYYSDGVCGAVAREAVR